MTLLSFRFFVLFLIVPFVLSAQEVVQLSGSVTDQKEALPAATVLLYTAKDSSLVKTAMTDVAGKFTFAVKADTYYLVVTSLGYTTVTTENIEADQKNTHEMPPIELFKNSKELQEVSITSSKPVLERRADKLLFNVDASPSTAGLTALEVLKKAPGVTVDQNENIALAGKSNVLVMIDGKQSYLSNQEVANMLKSMNSSQIETVEIMTNPGSKYEANSTGGIINIKTKKSKLEGFNGNLALGAGFNKFLQTNSSVDLNYRKKYFNLFGGYGYYRGESDQYLNIERTSLVDSERTFFHQQNIDTNKYDSQNFKIGSDFFLSSKHTVGLLVKGNFFNYQGDGFNTTDIGPSFTVVDSILKTPNTNTLHHQNISYNLNYKGQIDTAGQEITLDADYSTFQGKNNGNYVNKFYQPDGSFFKNGQIYRSHAPSDITIKALKIDYTLPFQKQYKLDVGLKVAKVQSDNDYVYENNINEEWVNDLNKSNRFKYDEQVNASYVTLSADFEQLSIQAGLRAEQTVSEGNSVTTNEVNKKKYTDLFPSVMISQNFNEDNILSFTYSRKINRPNYQNLNPFIFYVDQYTYNIGNPNLKPEYATNLETSYTFKQKYNASLAYSHTSDVISMVLLQDEIRKSMYQTTMNLASENIVSLTLNFPIKVTKWWDMSNNFIGFYKQLKSPDLNGSTLNSDQLSANLYNQNNFAISKLFTADLGLMYNSPQVEGTFRLKRIFNADAGLRYNLPNQVGNLKLGISDIFHTQKAVLASTLPDNDYRLEQYGSTTTVRLTFTYRFGKMTVKAARNRATALDEEQKRLN